MTNDEEIKIYLGSQGLLGDSYTPGRTSRPSLNIPTEEDPEMMEEGTDFWEIPEFTRTEDVPEFPYTKEDIPKPPYLDIGRYEESEHRIMPYSKEDEEYPGTIEESSGTLVARPEGMSPDTQLTKAVKRTGGVLRTTGKAIGRGIHEAGSGFIEGVQPVKTMRGMGKATGEGLRALGKIELKPAEYGAYGGFGGYGQRRGRASRLPTQTQLIMIQSLIEDAPEIYERLWHQDITPPQLIGLVRVYYPEVYNTLRALAKDFGREMGYGRRMGSQFFSREVNPRQSPLPPPSSFQRQSYDYGLTL